MPSMLELIRDKKAPGSMLRRAARGELSVSSREAIAILSVLIADGELRVEAEQTLRSFEEVPLREVASDRASPPEVLRCLLRTQAERPAIVEALCENPALALEELETAARQEGAATLEAMMRSARVRNSIRLVRLMKDNPALQAARRPGTPQEVPLAIQAEPQAEQPEVDESAVGNFYVAGHIQALLMRYSDGFPVPVEEERPFELVKGVEDEADPLADLLEQARQAEPSGASDDASEGEAQESEQLSLIQRIARMRVGERIKLAMRGNREERMILIRDRSKLVSQAVLASPKVNESEMESFAAMKNIQEVILRAIAANRKNMKSYGVIRALVNNPKAPLDVALPLINHLLLKDLRAVGISKNVNETLRQRAMRLYRLKTETKKES